MVNNQTVCFIRGHLYTRRMILLPMFAAHPYRVFCNEYLSDMPVCFTLSTCSCLFYPQSMLHTFTLPACDMPVCFTLPACYMPVPFTLPACYMPVSFTLPACYMPVPLTLPACYMPVSFTLPACYMPVCFTLPTCYISDVLPSQHITCLSVLPTQHVTCLFVLPFQDVTLLHAPTNFTWAKKNKVGGVFPQGLIRIGLRWWFEPGREYSNWVLVGMCRFGNLKVDPYVYQFLKKKWPIHIPTGPIFGQSLTKITWFF